MERFVKGAVGLYYVTLIAVILWSLTDGPVGPAVWHRSMRTCQGLARFFGTLGLHAERQYHESVEGSRL